MVEPLPWPARTLRGGTALLQACTWPSSAEREPVPALRAGPAGLGATWGRGGLQPACFPRHATRRGPRDPADPLPGECFPLPTQPLPPGGAAARRRLDVRKFKDTDIQTKPP